MAQNNIIRCHDCDQSDYLTENISDKDYRIQNWVNTGQYGCFQQINYSTTANWITSFHRCSTLPIVTIKVQENVISGICDTGASKSLISSGLFLLLWTFEELNKLEAPPNYSLIDINSNSLKIQGIKEFDFSIGNNNFNYHFVVFESNKNELLLGFDFFKEHKIIVSPTRGLFFEEQQIRMVDMLQQHRFEVLLKTEISLMPNTQQVSSFVINLDIKDPASLDLINKYMLFSSEYLQKNVPFEHLSIFHQYVFINPHLEFEAVLINNEESLQFFRARQLMGHVEKVEIINHISDLENDDLLCYLAHQLHDKDGESIEVPESRLFNDIDDEDLDLNQINCLSDNQEDREWLTNLHVQNKSMFATHEWSVGQQVGSSVHISLKTGATICKHKVARINPAIKERADRIIQMLLERNLIEISKSPWASRIIFVEKAPEEKPVTNAQQIAGKKQNHKLPRKLRLVCDFRHLNARIKQINTNWPNPTIFQMLSELHGARYVSIVDISQGFFHYKLDESSKQLTAFQYGPNVFSFNRLPQGLTISSKIMSYKMAKFVRTHALQGILVYIDNIVIQGPTLEIYKQRLEAFFRACVKDNIKIKMRKSFHFINDTFILFGFEVSLKTHFIRPEKDKIDKICAMIPPSNKTKTKSFIGAVTYFSAMIKNLQQILSPLHEISSPKTPFKWTEQCQQSFDAIKRELCKIPMIYLINPNKKIFATTDAAAGQSIGYTLWQFHTVLNKLCPVKFNSHKMSPSERNLSQYECEGLALIFCLVKENDLLSFGNLTLMTDCRSLTFISRFANSCSKLSRWDILIRSFAMTIQFLPNTDAHIRVTDLLTRNELKGGQPNKKIRENHLQNFTMFNFANLPPMEINDCMDFINTLNKLVDKAPLNLQTIAHLKQCFPCVPHLITRYEEGLIYYNMTQPRVALVESSHTIDSKDKPLTVLPPASHSISDIDWEAPTVTPIRIRDILTIFLHGMSVQNLIHFQSQEKWIIKLKETHNVFQVDGIYFRQYQLNNGVKVSQIILPDYLAYKLIDYYHKQPVNRHNGANQMKRGLEQVFYIRNFVKIAQSVIGKCQFCNLNKSYPAAKLSPGAKLIINAPKMVISIDVCTVRSSSVIDSFLTILDNFSSFVIFTPIRRDCTASDLIEALMTNWVRIFGFPMGIITDGQKSMIGQQLGNLCASMNTRMYRISPGNSQANKTERFNLIALNVLSYFDQVHGITDENFSMILSLVTNLVNSQINKTGYSPHFLQLGTNPRLNQFISLRNISRSKAMSEHVKSLIMAQNICFSIAQELQNTNNAPNPTKFRVGQFVLLRKLKQSGPRHGIKLRPKYFSEPFRIIRIFRTNALLVPYNKILFKKRVKGEGSIFKNQTTLARLTRLKPLRNPNTLLNLSNIDKFLTKLRKILEMPDPDCSVVELMPQPIESDNKFSKLLENFNPQHDILPQNIKVQLQDPQTHIEDICPVKMQPLRPGHSNDSLPSPTHQTVSTDISYTWLIIPKKQEEKKFQEISFDSSSSLCQIDKKDFDLDTWSSVSTHSRAESIFSDIMGHNLRIQYDTLDPNIHDTSSRYSDQKKITLSHSNSLPNIYDITDLSTPKKSSVVSNTPSSIQSSRPKRSFVSRINLSSGKSLILSVNPKSGHTLKDIDKN